MPPVGGPGGWDPRGGGPGRPGGPGGPRRGLPRGPLIPAIATAALIVVVAAIIVATRSSGGGNPSADSTAGSTAGAGATSSSSPAASSSPATQTDTAQRQGATQLAGLLGQNGSDRGDVDNAFYAAETCKTLPNDEQVFTRAAAKRDSLIAKIGTLTDVSALNPAMIQDLTGAWQASAQADTDYARWAQSMEGHCNPGKTAGNANYRAADGPDSTATSEKKAFTRLWNPVAGKYGLTKYSYTQL
jgi:hypothetical protein